MLFNKVDKIFNNLSQKLFFTVSTIIQFSFAFAIIYISLQLFLNYQDSYKKINNSLGSETLYFIENNEDYASKLYKKTDIDDYNNFYNYLEDHYNCITMSEDNFFISTSENVENFAIPDSPIYKHDENSYFTINSLTVNDNYFKNFKIKLFDGRYFDDNDYKSLDDSNEIPLILGYDYSDIFKLNDTIEFYDFFNKKNKIGKIVGFLEKGQCYIERPVSTNSIKSLDKTILIPNKPLNSSNISTDIISLNNVQLYNKITNSYFLNLSDEDILNIQKESIKQNFFDINISNMDESISYFKSLFKQQEIMYLSIFIMIILIASISTITNILNSINDRKREFGIYFAMGATKRYIIDLVVYEITFLLLLSAFLSTFIIKYIKIFEINELNIKGFILLFLIAIITSILISLIPIFKIKNTPMSELLKEE